jgi:hypothetical protein
LNLFDNTQFCEKLNAIDRFLQMADDAKRGYNHGALWNGLLILAQAAAAELRAELVAAEWHGVEQDGLPPLDGETVFIGLNEAGYVGCFNHITLGGTCVMLTAEEEVQVMSGLRWWWNFRWPPAERPLRLNLNRMPHRMHLQAMAGALVKAAERQGEVLTIEQRPLKPLAMGHHETVVTVRPALHAGRPQ